VKARTPLPMRVFTSGLLSLLNRAERGATT
jgi:hypothetical protein